MNRETIFKKSGAEGIWRIISNNHSSVYHDTEPKIGFETSFSMMKVKFLKELSTQHEEELINKRIINTCLSVKALNCLKSAQIDTIGDLVGSNLNDLLKFRNFGENSLSKLIQDIRKEGIDISLPPKKKRDINIENRKDYKIGMIQTELEMNTTNDMAQLNALCDALYISSKGTNHFKEALSLLSNINELYKEEFENLNP